jgi:isocitrate lyase
MNDLTKVILEKKECWLMLRFKDKKLRKCCMCKHQRMAGSNLGDDHKTFFAGDKALKADGAKNTSNQFESKKMLQNEN